MIAFLASLCVPVFRVPIFILLPPTHPGPYIDRFCMADAFQRVNTRFHSLFLHSGSPLAVILQLDVHHYCQSPRHYVQPILLRTFLFILVPKRIIRSLRVLCLHSYPALVRLASPQCRLLFSACIYAQSPYSSISAHR